MSLPARQQHVLDRIERTLVAEEPRLGSLFAVFTRMTRHEAMPGTEHVTNPLHRRAAVIAITLIAVMGIVAALWLAPGGLACPSPPGAAGHSLSGSRAAGCRPGPAPGLTRE
jgi:hypothetical protein